MREPQIWIPDIEFYQKVSSHAQALAVALAGDVFKSRARAELVNIFHRIDVKWRVGELSE